MSRGRLDAASSMCVCACVHACVCVRARARARAFHAMSCLVLIEMLARDRRERRQGVVSGYPLRSS